MSRKIYNRLSFMAVSWLDESTLLNLPEPCGQTQTGVALLGIFSSQELLARTRGAL
jgi:hypothetical protein